MGIVHYIRSDNMDKAYFHAIYFISTPGLMQKTYNIVHDIHRWTELDFED